MVSTLNMVLLAIAAVVAITLAVYYTQLSRAMRETPPTPIYVAKPDWYVTDREWHANKKLYDGGNYYYSDHSRPKI